MKMLGNFVLFIWLKFKVTSNLAAENLALRHQLAVMKRTNKRPKIRMVDRLFWVLLSRIWTPWRKSLIIVKPDTVVYWHRKGFKLFWKFKSKGPGRPQVSREIRDLVRRMAAANPDPQPQPPQSRTFQYNLKSDGRVDNPTDRGGLPLGYGTEVSDAGSGCNLWRFFPKSSEKHGHQRSGLGPAKPLAKPSC